MTGRSAIIRVLGEDSMMAKPTPASPAPTGTMWRKTPTS